MADFDFQRWTANATAAKPRINRHHARRGAGSECRNDQEAAIEIEARLKRSGAIVQAPPSTLVGVWMPLGPDRLRLAVRPLSEVGRRKRTLVE